MSTQSDQPVGPSSDAAEAVKLPAIGLMVTAGVGLVFQLLGIVMNLAGIGMGAAAPEVKSSFS